MHQERARVGRAVRHREFPPRYPHRSTIANRERLRGSAAWFIDLDERTITYARAGHTPFIYLQPGGPAGARMLAPDGLVLGLRGLEGHFDALIEERTQPIGSGDLAVLFTDGITEAMNEEADMFGEERLSRLLQEHAALGPTALLDRVLQDVEAFVGTADQHDDMTMVLVRVDELPVSRRELLVPAAIA